MELKKLTQKGKALAGKYRYALLVLVIGLVLLWMPDKNSKEVTKTEEPVKVEKNQQVISQDALVEILQSVQGAGKVRVLISVAKGEETLYQTDNETSSDSENSSVKTKTVIITDSGRSETGLVRQINPATCLGAIVVCQGADNPSVRLAITQAVSKITGLGADAICVLKMQ